jgi:hypothetical protein
LITLAADARFHKVDERERSIAVIEIADILSAEPERQVEELMPPLAGLTETERPPDPNSLCVPLVTEPDLGVLVHGNEAGHCRRVAHITSTNPAVLVTQSFGAIGRRGEQQPWCFEPAQAQNESPSRDPGTPAVFERRNDMTDAAIRPTLECHGSGPQQHLHVRR